MTSSMISRLARVAALSAVVAVAVLVPLSAHAADDAAREAARCSSLVSHTLSDARVTSARHHPAGRFSPPTGADFDVARAFCRVEVAAAPVPGSDIRIELWLPDAAAWNGRFWGLGNGSFGGQITHRGLGVRVGAGYAVVATDTGHQADPSDARWARGQPEKIVDYGHRATQLAAVHGQALSTAYLGRRPDRAYFSAYSNGGRQALMLAQRSPELYDGIMAGAPAQELTRLYLAAAEFQRRLHRVPGAMLSAAQLARLSSAVLGACDALDGVADGVLENPLRCGFDPGVLACDAPRTPPLAPATPVAAECLTPVQVDSVRSLYTGVAVPGHGDAPFAAMARGSEPGWHGLLFGDAPGASGLASPIHAFLRDMAGAIDAPDLGGFDLARDAPVVTQRLSPALDARSPDLRRFIARGGKLILWHGWNDAVVPPGLALGYHADLLRALGPQAVAGSVRLFMAPGVEHGAGGPGADRFGQHASGDGDPARSLGAALQRWVEQGEAPEQVVASRLKVPADAANPVARTRLLCAWPRVAAYQGSGSTDDAQHFRCVDPGPAAR